MNAGLVPWRTAVPKEGTEKIVEIAGSVALVSGANRGLGAAFCRALLEAGASKVYAGARDIESFGWEMRTRVGRLEELATIVRALLAGERVTFHGRYHTVVSAQISPLPRVPVSLWLAGTVPEAAARAGRLGDAWLCGQNASPAELKAQLAVYREAAAQAGRIPRPVLRRDIFVGETDTDARTVVEPILAEGYRGTGHDTLLVGGPETVIRQLREYRAMGFEEVMVRHIVGDHQQMLESFERIGRHVMPAIRGL